MQSHENVRSGKRRKQGKRPRRNGLLASTCAILQNLCPILQTPTRLLQNCRILFILIARPKQPEGLCNECSRQCSRQCFRLCSSSSTYCQRDFHRCNQTAGPTHVPANRRVIDEQSTGRRYSWHLPCGG